MANITQYLQRLMNAVYGEEVRGSIRDALLSIDNDVTGLSNKHDALEERVEELEKPVVEALVAEKVAYDNASSGLTGENVQEVLDDAAFSSIGSLVGVNIDDMANNKQFGVFWLNTAANTYTGTKPPDSSGQGLLIVKRQTNEYIRQAYVGFTGYGYACRYWDGTKWSDWVNGPRYPQVESFSGTPSANGNINHVFSNKIVVLAAWSNASDQTVNAYPSVGVTTGGSVSWWFHVRQANTTNSVVTSAITITCLYVTLT
jgi:hypothetical protein